MSAALILALWLVGILLCTPLRSPTRLRSSTPLRSLVGEWTSAHADEPTGLARAQALTQEAARALSQSRVAEALKATGAALALVPEALNARRNVALVHSMLGEGQLEQEQAFAARESFERALELHPGRLCYRLGRARALLMLGGLSDAEREARELVEAESTYLAAWRLLGDVNERQGELAEAVKALGRALELGPQDEALGRRVSVLARRALAEERYQSQNTGHFEARYDPDLDPGAVTLALTLLEDAYTRVTSDLGLLPRTPARVILYPDEEFRAVTGAHSWVGALYAGGVLRVPMRNLERHRSTAARVLAHEFTHHILSEQASRLPVWWHEAIAQWMEHGTQAHQAASQAQSLLISALALGRLLTLEELRSTQIVRVANADMARLYYTQSLAFVGWLIERRGGISTVASFLLALGGGSDTEAAARAAWGASESDLYAEWAAELETAAQERSRR